MRVAILTPALMVAVSVGAPAGKAAAQQVVPDGESCSACQVEVHVLVQLGASEPPGELPGPASVTMDSRGQYLVVPATAPLLLFDRQGVFLRAIGRTGGGPGEFTLPRAAVTVGDSMAVFDRDGRITLFGSDYTVVRTARVPFAVNAVAVLTWPSAVLVNGNIVDLTNGVGTARRSLGLPSSPRIGPARSGAVWVADALKYEVSRWNAEGRVLAFARDPDWFRNPSFAPGSPSVPPSPYIAALTEDEQGRVWIFSRVPAPTWQEAWAGKPTSPSGTAEVSLSVVPAQHELYRTIVDVYDPATGRVVANARVLDKYIIGVLPDGRLVSYSEAAFGIPEVQVLELRLRNP